MRKVGVQTDLRYWEKASLHVEGESVTTIFSDGDSTGEIVDAIRRLVKPKDTVWLDWNDKFNGRSVVFAAIQERGASIV